MSKKKLLTQAVSSGGESVNVADVFSTYLYKGNGSTQTITNGIDLTEHGGMVWTKSRTSATQHAVSDTERGIPSTIFPSITNQESTSTGYFTSFNSDGWSMGGNTETNVANEDFVSWTFRKAPRFFDVVKYTGNGVAGREIAHELGCDVGMLIVKAISGSDSWFVQHTAIGGTNRISLNSTSPASPAGLWNNTSFTDTVFTLGGDNWGVNNIGVEYIAYIYAHDPLGENGDDGMIACGSFVTDSNGNGPLQNLGWEPQFVIQKVSSSGSGGWYMTDSIRGMSKTGTQLLRANSSAAEGAENTEFVSLSATGFTPVNNIMPANKTCVYIAIRAPMMVEPESADEVFSVQNGDGSSNPAYTSGFVVDMAFWRPTSADNTKISSRLTSERVLETNGKAVEVSDPSFVFDYMYGWLSSTRGANDISYMWKRAKGYFDVVCYEGDGQAGKTVNHSLGVVPEIIWVKARDDSNSFWCVYNKTVGNSSALVLNENYPPIDGGTPVSFWNSTTPTESLFTLGTYPNLNTNNKNYITYLFATLSGISKVFSYTGDGASQTIDCGFSAGARFVLIKRTDSGGDWHIWDSLRGIVAGNDPHLSLNTTAAQVTTDDSIDPHASGFIVNQVSATNINVNAATYIGYAIA